MCLNFCLLYYIENIELIECRNVGLLVINPKMVGEGLLLHIENLHTPQSLLDRKGYSRLQRLLSIWHRIIHKMRYMKSSCTHLIVKPRNILIGYIYSFQWNQGTCVLGYVQANLIHLGHLLLLILVGQWYLWFITCHRGCVGQSSCFYL